MTRSTSAPNSTLSVLVVDDEADMRALLTDLLRDEGFRVHGAADASSALAAVDTVRLDVVLLDVTMPSMNGLDVLVEIRQRRDIPVILLTGRGGEADRVIGLRMGADDYVVKPFSGPELIARIQSVTRRLRRVESVEHDLEFGRLRIDVSAREAYLDDALVATTAKEFDLLLFLARAPRRVFSREQLLENVWSSSTRWQDPATVTEHIRRIRRKIEVDPDHPLWVRTVRGVGYRFEPGGSTSAGYRNTEQVGNLR